MIEALTLNPQPSNKDCCVNSIKKVLIIFLAFAFSSVAYSNDEGAMKTRQEFVDWIFTDGLTDEHTCKRVAEFGKGRVSPESCKSQLPEVNAYCIAKAGKYVPNEIGLEEENLLLKHFMTCPMAKILEYRHDIIDGKIYIKWSDEPNS